MPIKNYAIGDGLLSAQIQDERGKLNLNDLAAAPGDELQKKTKIQRFKRLFELLQLSPDLVDALVDWVDADENQEPVGAESQFYQSQRPPYRAANTPLVGFGDLRLVKGFTPEIVDRLSRYVTLFPAEGGALVNLNTSDLLVIQSLDPAITQTPVGPRVPLSVPGHAEVGSMAKATRRHRARLKFQGAEPKELDMRVLWS